MHDYPLGNSAAFSVSRCGRRYPLMLPLRVLIRRYRGQGLQPTQRVSRTVTQNISSSGCYFLLDCEPGLRDPVEMEVFIQPSPESTLYGRAICRGRVVRVERERKTGKVGVACTIDHYRLRPSFEDHEEGALSGPFF